MPWKNPRRLRWNGPPSSHAARPSCPRKTATGLPNGASRPASDATRQPSFHLHLNSIKWPTPDGDPADVRRSRHLSVRRTEALGHRACAGGAAARAKSAPRSWCCTASAATRTPRNVLAPTKVLNELGYVTLRFDMRGCGDSEGEFGRRDLPRAGRGHAQRADLPGASIPRSIPSASRVIGSSFGGAVARLCRRRRRARRGRHLQRRLGRRRAQVPRPAQERRRNGRASPRCSRTAASTAPGPASR